MALEVGEVVAVLKADSSQFSSGIDDANKSLNKMKSDFSGIETPLNSTGMGLVSLGGKITAAATAMGALGVAAAKEFGSFAEELEMTSQKTGVGVETLQKWNFALNRVGMDINQLLPGFKKLSTTVTAAFGGDAKAIAKIEHLGLSIDELKGKNPEQLFLALAGAIAKIEDPLERNAALTSTFGKAGMGLVPILGEVSTGFAESGKQAEALGLVFSGDALSSASALDDSFDDLTATMAGFSRTVAATFSGPLKDVIVVLTESLGAFNVWWQGIDDGTKKVVLIFTGAFAASGPIIAVIGAFMVAVSAGLGPLLVGGAIVTGILAGVAAIAANWEVLKGKTVVAWTQLKVGVVDLVQSMMLEIKQFFVDKLNAIIAPIKKFSDDVYGVFFTLKDKLVGHSVVPDMVEEIGDHMRMLDKNMTAPARVAAQGTWDVFRDLSGKMDSASRQVSTTIMSVWSSATSTMSNALATQILKGNDWKATMDSLSMSVLSTFINLGIQLIAQKAMQLAAWAVLDGQILASETATAGGVAAIWTTTSGAVIGAFGAMTGAIQAFFVETIIPMFIQIGTAVMEFLTAIATAEAFTVFGIPFSVGTLAGVALIAAAIASIAAFSFGAFAKGGVITKPTMALMGEAGPEAVIPLNQLGSFMGGGPTTVQVQLDGRTIAKSVFDHMPSVMRVRGVSA